MPSYVIHLSCAKRALEMLPEMNAQEQNAFFLGNMIAETVIKLARIEEPIAKGLALGTSAHAIGTAKAMELGEIEGAMSSLAIAVAGLLTVIGASVFAQFM